MKSSKFLVFRIDSQQFAVRTNMVLNIVEKAKIINHIILDGNKPFYNSALSFRGMVVPIINMHEILGMKKDSSEVNDSVLIVEVIIAKKPELAGILIRDIVEIAEFDDFFAYPYIPIKNNSCADLREGIIIRNNQPVIVINSSKIFASNIYESKVEPMNIFAN
jgi:chemotaxis signal transduction protein